MYVKVRIPCINFHLQFSSFADYCVSHYALRMYLIEVEEMRVNVECYVFPLHCPLSLAD